MVAKAGLTDIKGLALMVAQAKYGHDATAKQFLGGK